MKKIALLVSTIAGALVLQAQSLDAGKKFFYYQRYQSAEVAFHDQLKQTPENAEAWLWLVKSYAAQNETRQAIDSFKLAPASLKEEPYYMLASGTVQLLNNNPAEARQLFEKAIDETKGKNATILGLVAEANVEAEKGDVNYAIEVIGRAIKRDKNNPALHTALGNAYRKLHNGSEAFKAFSQAVNKEDKYAEALYQLGQIFVTQKNAEMYLEYFNKAVAADKNYAPALYELYEHYLYREPVKAMEYFRQYAAVSDKTASHEYDMADLLYLTKSYNDAIVKGKHLLTWPDVPPRIYKLVAYSYAELKDSVKALDYMKQYFVAGSDSDFIAKDYETMGDLYVSLPNQEDSAMVYYQKAVEATADSSEHHKYYARLASLAKARQDYVQQAKWLGKYYNSRSDASNLDLFNWGVAAYRAQDYHQSDSAFALYTGKYPEQAFGYYWRALNNAAIDTAMTEGRAIPHYQKLIEVIGDDSVTANHRKWKMDAYTYLAAYETNTEKDYVEAISYFGKILEMDPNNEDAKKYIAILEKNLAATKEDSN